VTGVEVVIEIVFSSVWHRYQNNYGILKIMKSRPWPFGVGHVTSSVTWPFDSRWSTFYGWSIVTCPFVYLALLWRYGRLKFFQKGSSRNRGRSSVGPQYYTDFIYSSSLR